MSMQRSPDCDCMTDRLGIVSDQSRPLPGVRSKNIAFGVCLFCPQTYSPSHFSSLSPLPIWICPVRHIVVKDAGSTRILFAANCRINSVHCMLASLTSDFIIAVRVLEKPYRSRLFRTIPAPISKGFYKASSVIPLIVLWT